MLQIAGLVLAELAHPLAIRVVCPDAQYWSFGGASGFFCPSNIHVADKALVIYRVILVLCALLEAALFLGQVRLLWSGRRRIARALGVQGDPWRPLLFLLCGCWFVPLMQERRLVSEAVGEAMRAPIAKHVDTSHADCV
jgi:hypothetical protein